MIVKKNYQKGYKMLTEMKASDLPKSKIYTKTGKQSLTGLTVHGEK